jgi:hypothetical protein
VQRDVGPEQRSRATQVGVGELFLPARRIQHAVHQASVDQYESRLEQVQGEHGDLLRFAVRAGQFGLAAIVNGDVGGVPLLDDLEPFVDLAAQVGVGEVVGDERRTDRAAEFFDRGQGWVLGAFGGGATQDLLGLGGAQLQRPRVFDHLVVLLGDQVPVDRPGEYRLQPPGRPHQVAARWQDGAA